MKAIVFTDERLTHHIYWGREFAAGLQKHGCKVQLMDRNHTRNVPHCNLLVLWGIRKQEMIRMQKDRGGEVCVLERGYIADRFNWTSVSFGGGLNGRGIYRGPLADASRWTKHFLPLLRFWQDKPEGYALIMGQVPGDTAVKNVDLPAFYKKAAAAFAEQGIETKFRAHPRFGQSTPLACDLKDARCVVTWNSNSGVDAVLAGVPTIAMDEGAMAWEVTGHKFKLPPTPDRTAWCHALAWKQWSLEEMTSGYCWDMIKGAA